MASSYASLGNPLAQAPNLRWMYLPRPEAAAPALRHPDWVLQHGAKPSLNSSSSPPLSHDSYHLCLLHVHNLHAQNLLNQPTDNGQYQDCNMYSQHLTILLCS